MMPPTTARHPYPQPMPRPKPKPFTSVSMKDNASYLIDRHYSYTAPIGNNTKALMFMMSSLQYIPDGTAQEAGRAAWQLSGGLAAQNSTASLLETKAKALLPKEAEVPSAVVYELYKVNKNKEIRVPFGEQRLTVNTNSVSMDLTWRLR